MSKEYGNVTETTATEERPPSQRNFVALILIVEFLERITFYSVCANLMIFCQSSLQLKSQDACVVVLVFIGASYVFPLFGSWITETFSGKYNAIYFSCLIYFVGTCLLPVVAYNEKEKYELTVHEKQIFFAIALVLISVGTGGIKANISAFGAEQVARNGEAAIRNFFTWFYWLINVASVISFSFIAYLQTKSFFHGYIPMVGAMFLSVIVFLCGRSNYNCKPPNGSPLTDVVRITCHAISRKMNYKKVVKAELPVGATLDLLDFAHINFGGKYSTDQVDLVRCVGRIALVFISILFFWTVYFQMATTFLLQGQYMKLKLTQDFSIPAASLNLFECIVILVAIKFMEVCVYPMCRYFQFDLSPLRRMGFGMLLVTTSMVAAALIEQYRKTYDEKEINTISGKTYNASSVSVFLQVPQYALIGFSEVFTSIAALEFAYTQSPRFLQSAIMGLFMATSGVGALVGGVIVAVFAKYSNYFCDDINSCKLEYYFFILAGISFLNFLVFTSVAVKYSYVEDYLLSSPVTSKRSRDGSLFEHSSSSSEVTWKRTSPVSGEGHI